MLEPMGVLVGAMRGVEVDVLMDVSAVAEGWRRRDRAVGPPRIWTEMGRQMCSTMPISSYPELLSCVATRERRTLS